MYEKDFKKDQVIIQEGDTGSHLYVLEGKGMYWNWFVSI
jgi:CRP-like cAMP-binding protein